MRGAHRPRDASERSGARGGYRSALACDNRAGHEGKTLKQAFRVLPPSGRRIATTLACAFVLGLTAVAPAFASVLFNGDFETGDTLQWSFEQQGGDANDDITVQSETRIQGAYAGRFTVEPGDHFPAGQTTGERAEVLNSGMLFRERDVRWFGWSVYFASGFPTSDDSGTWNVFTQWHHNGSSCSVPLDFSIRDDGSDARRRLVLTSRTGTVSATTCSLTGREFDLGLLRTGEWIRFEAQVRFSADPRFGYVKVYVDDQLVLPRTSMTTLYACCRSYMKQGYYRRANAENTATLYIDGTTVGTARADVEQPEAPSLEKSGSVNSSPAGIACESTCAGWFPYGTEVTLTAAPEAHAVFTSWLGACANESNAAC
jgi:hypothetical protein